MRKPLRDRKPFRRIPGPRLNPRRVKGAPKLRRNTRRTIGIPAN